MTNRVLFFALPALIAIALPACAQAVDALAIAVDKIVNANTEPTSFFPESLQVKMKFADRSSARFSGAQFARIAPMRATDDTGLSLLNSDRYEAKWQKFNYGAPDIELDAPARGAKTLRELSGKVEIYRPAADNASVVTVPSISKLAPQTLDNPLLKAANIQITLITYGELERYRQSLRDPKIAYPPASEQILKREIGRSLPYYLKNTESSNRADFTLYIEDPDHRLIAEEIQTPSDEKVSVSQSSTGGRTTFNFSETPPPDFGLKLLVATPQTVAQIPFRFTDLTLPARAAQAPVVATSVSDDRQPKGSIIPGSLDVKLKIALPEVEAARNIRIALASAVDAAGKPLVNTELYKNSWDEIEPTDNRRTASAKIRLQTPTRTAKTLREVSGQIELYDPARDPRSVVTIADISAQAGRTLADPTLKSLGLEIAFLNQQELDRARKAELDAPAPDSAPGLTPALKKEIFSAFSQLFGNLTLDEKSIAFRVLDPQTRLVDIALETADGQTLKRTGSSSGGGVQTYKFENAIPADAKLKIYVATPQSVTQVPFKLSDVPLP